MNEVLRLLRIAHDYSIKETAELLGVTPSFISKIENGVKRPSDELIKRYSRVFRVSTKTIKFFDEEHKKNDYRYQELMLLILEKIINKKNSKK